MENCFIKTPLLSKFQGIKFRGHKELPKVLSFLSYGMCLVFNIWSHVIVGFLRNAFVALKK